MYNIFIEQQAIIGPAFIKLEKFTPSVAAIFNLAL
jgi:hypothetical protein